MNAKIQQFIANLVDEFQMDETRLNEMWKEVETPAEDEEETMTCWHIFTKGTNNGKRCSKVVKKGGFCTAHSKKNDKVFFECNHIFTKGKKDGEKCSVKVATKDGMCSKHTIPDENDKKMGMKRWEQHLFMQIPDRLQGYYTNEKEYLVGAKLTRTTANNVAAWIMVKYETYFVHQEPSDYFNGIIDFHQQMRDALLASDIHPVHKMAEYFDPEDPAPSESDALVYELYLQDKARYDVAKKMYASQYP